VESFQGKNLIRVFTEVLMIAEKIYLIGGVKELLEADERVLRVFEGLTFLMKI
jgi:hypothetical protein